MTRLFSQLPVPALDQLQLRSLAHLGDAAYELFIRQLAAAHVGSHKTEILHKFTTQRVQSSFQHQLLEYLQDHLTDEEMNWVRRGRNVPVKASMKVPQHVARQATAFEVLCGVLYLTQPERLEQLLMACLPHLTEHTT